MLDLQVYLKELEEIVSIESPSSYPEGTRAVAEYLQQKLAAIGWTTEFIDCGLTVGPCLRAVNKPSDKYDLLMLGHTDTVFPLGTIKGWPFSVQDNIARGPGVSDMKGGLLFMYHTAKYLTEQNMLGDKTICLLFNPDEEAGSNASRAIIEQEAAKSAMVFVLEPGRPNGAMVKERKGVGIYDLEFQGIAAHAGVAPQNGASALLELFNWGIELSKLTDYDKGTTINVGVASGGSVVNVVPEKATAKVDLRILDMAEAERVDASIQKLLNNPFNPKVKAIVSGGVNRPPMTCVPAALAACETVSKIAAELGVDLEFISTGGGSDGNFTSGMGVPTLDGMGPVGGDFHSRNEYGNVETYPLRFKILVEAVKRLILAQ